MAVSRFLTDLERKMVPWVAAVEALSYQGLTAVSAGKEVRGGILGSREYLLFN